MELLLTLILAHLFADFPLQTNTIARLKSQRLAGVLLHVLIYVTTTALLLEHPFSYWPLLIGLGGAHFMIDAIKAAICKKQPSPFAFLIDQCLHLFSMVVAVYIAHNAWSQAPQGILPPHLLLGASSAALLPVAMVYCWIWTTSNNEEQINQSALLSWICAQMLVCEQCFGLAVMTVVIWMLATQEFELLLQLAQR